MVVRPQLFRLHSRFALICLPFYGVFNFLHVVLYQYLFSYRCMCSTSQILEFSVCSIHATINLIFCTRVTISIFYYMSFTSRPIQFLICEFHAPPYLIFSILLWPTFLYMGISHHGLAKMI